MLKELFEWKKIRGAVQCAVYLIAVMFLQGVLFTRLSVFGVKGIITPAAVAVMGMQMGGVKGAVFGIFAGIFSDMSFSENTVLFTLLFPAMGFLVGFLSEFYINKNFFTFMVMSVACSILTALAQVFRAVLLSGAELLPALLTALLQILVSLLPMAVLYLPFRKRNANE
ncbi:MAG: hypothetical protein HUJ66_08080 [Oscillospiraceae bacterium]|nr:hypothetical protein [Oscillospiraceae bacterium]